MDSFKPGRGMDELVREVERVVAAELRRRRLPLNLVPDLVQEALAEMHRQAHERPEGTPGSMENDLEAGLRRPRNQLKSGIYRWEILDDGTLALDRRSSPATQEEQVLVGEVLRCETLSPVERDVLRLSFAEGFINREIASRLGKTEHAVAGLKRRAIERVAAHVGVDRARSHEARKQVVRLSPVAGQEPAKRRWSARLGAGLYGWSCAVDREGGFVLLGWLRDTAIFGGVRLENDTSWPWKLWMVRIGPDQQVAPVVCLAGAAQQYGQSIALDSDGHVVVAAYFSEAIQVAGEAPLSSRTPEQPAVLLTKVDRTTGRPLWEGTRLIGQRGQREHGLLVDAQGNIVVSSLVAESEGDDFTLVIRRYDRHGQPLKGWEYLHAGQYRGWSVIKAGAGLLVTGRYDGTIDFGGQHRKQHRRGDFFLAKLDIDGNCTWLRSYGGSHEQRGVSCCVDPQGYVTLAGYFEGTIHFDGEPLRSRSDGDVFVARLDPSGHPMWSASYAGSRAPLGISVAAGPDGSVFLAGNLGPRGPARSARRARASPGRSVPRRSAATVPISGTWWSVKAPMVGSGATSPSIRAAVWCCRSTARVALARRAAEINARRRISAWRGTGSGCSAARTAPGPFVACA
ncbi:MAG: sigma-70 family RNA polymerase sigma factor [Byssovorax sp.]